MGLARRIGQFVGKSRTRQIEYCLLVLKEINIDSPNIVGVVVFQRLTPLLLLRVVPRIDLGDDAKFENDQSLKDALLDALQHVVKSPDEEREVRRIACECIAQMVGSPPWRFFLSILDDASNNNNELRRAAIYGMCHCVVCRIHEKDFGADVIPFVAIEIVLKAVDDPSSLKEEFEKRTMGIQEFLVLAIVCEGLMEWKRQGFESRPSSTNRRPGVEELNAKDTNQQASGDGNALRILSFLMEQLLMDPLNKNNSFASIKAVIASALGLTGKTLMARTIEEPSPEPVSMAANALLAARISDEDIAFAASGFARMIVTQIVSTWSPSRAPIDAEMFVIFNSAFAAVKNGVTCFLGPTILNKLAMTCVVVVQTTSISKIYTLNVLGVVLILPDEEKYLEEGMMGRIYSVLRSLSNVDPDAETRTMASKMLIAFFS